MENTKQTNLKFNIIAIISIIVFAFALSPKTLQNDTFYTIKIGEYILNNGITMQDPFSWHNLSYTFPHWAYDVMIYSIYNIGGHLGIYISTIVFASFLGIVIYITNDKLTKNKPMSFILTLAALYLLKDFIAARAQLLTFILFALEFLFIEKFLETNNKRYVFGLLIIPVIIANVHVAVFPFYFVIYLPYFAEYFISLLMDVPQSIIQKRILKMENRLLNNTKESKIENLSKKINALKKKEEKLLKLKNREPYKIKVTKRNNTKFLIIIFIICIFAGLLTPLKDVPYTYLIKTMQGNSTQNINEHLPLVLANNVIFAVVLLFFVQIITFTDTKIRLCDLFMLGGLTVLAFMSRRQESMFIIMCLPIFNKLVTSFIDKYDKNIVNKLKSSILTFCGVIITFGIVLIISVICYNNKFKNEYVSKSSYPVEASNWIKENLDINQIKLYNEYNFGSYLLFQGIPVFVDSRCDLYLPEFNKDVRVFDDFLTISNLNSKNLEEIFNKYGFTHFITNSNARLNIYLNAKPEEFNRIYSDQYFNIYEKK